MSNKSDQEDDARLTHIDEQGQAKMVDVGAKEITERLAVAIAKVNMQAETLELIVSGSAKKGDILAVARIAGIQAAKKCSELIPLCHPLALNSVDVHFDLNKQECQILIIATCKVSGKTGVEMEVSMSTYL